jgi:hypothetical protein
MRSLDSITFDTTGLALQGDLDSTRVWHTWVGDGIGLYYFNKPPDIDADPDSVDEVRNFYRLLVASAGVGIIEVETLILDECRAIRTIFKVSQQPSGMTYLGSITLPFRDFSYVIKVQCMEYGATGIREAVVADALLASEQIQIQSDGERRAEILGWSRDPYGCSVDAPLKRNRAEAEEYDSQFPEHPLSRLRTILREIQDSVHIAAGIKSEPAFAFPSVRVKKPWWKMWRIR